MDNKISFEEKLNIIKNISDEEIRNFPERRKEVVEKIKQGMQVSDIVRQMGCTRQNIYHLIDSIVVQQPKKTKNPKNRQKINKKDKFENYTDFSVLSKREFCISDFLNIFCFRLDKIPQLRYTYIKIKEGRKQK